MFYLIPEAKQKRLLLYSGTRQLRDMLQVRCKILENLRKFYQILQNPTKSYNILQNPTKFYKIQKILQNPMNSKTFLEILENLRNCIFIYSLATLHVSLCLYLCCIFLRRQRAR